MGRKNIGLIIDVLNHNKTDPNLRNVNQKIEIPAHLQADWDKMAGKPPKTGGKKAAAKKAAPKKPISRKAQLTALALAYVTAEAGNLFNNNDGAEDVAADEVMDAILAQHGQPGEDEEAFDRAAIEASLNTAFAEFEEILEENLDEDE